MTAPDPAQQPGDHAAPLTPVDPQRQLEFLEMNEVDAQRLRAMMEDFHVWADDFVEAFYRHLFAFSGTAKFLKSPETVARLKRSQREHLESMLKAEWNDEYFQQRQHVGHVHAEVGIEPQYFLSAFNQYVQFVLEKAAEKHPHDVTAFKEQAGSLLKAVFLDIGLTLDAYFVQSTRNLRQALEMFWRANAELRQFAQLTSHDLKTPLATVANLCDEALDEFGEQMPPAAAQLIGAARDRTFRMSRMIDELLASAWPQESDQPRENVSSQEALEEAMEAARAQLAESGVEVQIERPLPRVRGNKARLREAFGHLLSNAAKFIDRRPGRLSIEALERNGQCVLVFADNGPGIPVEEQERIFAPFRRLAMHRDRPGSGLGLYFAKNLITQQGGRIWVESSLGEGSRFHVELPSADEPQTAEEA